MVVVVYVASLTQLLDVALLPRFLASSLIHDSDCLIPLTPYYLSIAHHLQPSRNKSAAIMSFLRMLALATTTLPVASVRYTPPHSFHRSQDGSIDRARYCTVYHGTE
jgi:cytochrome c biogenesis protein CcdA